MYEQNREKCTYLRGKVFTDNYYLLTVIAYNQIDVIILRQHVTGTAVTIRALTSSNTKHDDTAVSCSSSLSSCPTEKGGCAYISTPLLKLLKAELKPSAMCRHLAAVQLILHLVLSLKNGRLKLNWREMRKTVAHYCQLIPRNHFYSLQETGILQESLVQLG